MRKMIIKVDAEGKKAIDGLCDVALKTGGIQNLAAITGILTSVRMIPEEEEIRGTEDE